MLNIYLIITTFLLLIAVSIYYTWHISSWSDINISRLEINKYLFQERIKLLQEEETLDAQGELEIQKDLLSSDVYFGKDIQLSLKPIILCIFSIPIITLCLYVNIGSANILAQRYEIEDEMRHTKELKYIVEEIERYESYIRTNPQNTAVWNLLGIMYASINTNKIHTYNKAEQAFMNAIAIAGNSISSQDFQSFSEIKTDEDFEQNLGAQKVMNFLEIQSIAVYKLAESSKYYLTNNAQSLLSRALTMQPDNQNFQYIQALNLLNSNQTEQAKTILVTLAQNNYTQAENMPDFNMVLTETGIETNSISGKESSNNRTNKHWFRSIK